MSSAYRQGQQILPSAPDVEEMKPRLVEETINRLQRLAWIAPAIGLDCTHWLKNVLKFSLVLSNPIGYTIFRVHL